MGIGRSIEDGCCRMRDTSSDPCKRDWAPAEIRGAVSQKHGSPNLVHAPQVGRVLSIHRLRLDNVSTCDGYFTYS